MYNMPLCVVLEFPFLSSTQESIVSPPKETPRIRRRQPIHNMCGPELSSANSPALSKSETPSTSRTQVVQEQHQPGILIVYLLKYQTMRQYEVQKSTPMGHKIHCEAEDCWKVLDSQRMESQSYPASQTIGTKVQDGYMPAVFMSSTFHYGH